MKIGILKCDTIIDTFENYDKIILDFLKLSDNNIFVKSFNCVNGELPDDSDFNYYNGFIISGSQYSVHDDFDWIFDLKVKIREMNRLNIKMIGISFGHQIIINALGGKVEINEKGWEILETPIYDTIENSLFYINQLHHEIVTKIPDDFIEIFYNENSRFQGCLKINILTLQGHPEYDSFNITQLLKNRKDTIDFNHNILNKNNLKKNTIVFSNIFYKFFSSNTIP